MVKFAIEKLLDLNLTSIGSVANLGAQCPRLRKRGVCDREPLVSNIAILCMFLTLGASATWSQIRDAAGAPPEAGKLEFENESMAVVRIHMAPHEKTPMHDIASPRLVIWLTDVHLKDTRSDGSVSQYRRPAGSIDWITPRRHMGENMSDQSLDFLAIIPKPVTGAGSHAASPH